ncbi:hypothetical protein [Limnohabitans sp. DM1]|uniref:hypothetical protein n=1 Tax=Limnohabitans sp. DM1 TaxID=1597955 RepID=UPI000A7615D1|nr:hypothetical protein [Limnohabitans sp. DM1]
MFISKFNQAARFEAWEAAFPFAIYYLLEGKKATVSAVLDTRRSPEWLRERQCL